ncbi:ParB/RepB/Spo0J family partition protein [Pelagibaculum spongiae]|uniref:ParB-like N-terminal domain-containing protein n=1 Tax=Pelagibaculum spongiae TaxID=2080658 RepID=A0A2V1GPE6_9GAMM|nr:ParB/RepB/Spo0J family partition protein [Pelagibaculum spongiae]PVZ64459.1 hypothetical protein DC094_19270 [Pelagibaculum spongiae]
MTSFIKRKEAKDQAQKEKSDKKIERQVTNLDDFLLDQPNMAGVVNIYDRHLIKKPFNKFYVDDQVRKKIDPQELEERAASMRANGQLQAIIVYPADEEGPNRGKHKIDKGECRWRASQLIEGFELEAVVDPLAPKRNRQKRIVGQIIENDQRADLQPLELALALSELIAQGLNQEEIAEELGWITRSKKPNINKVSRILSINKLPEEGKNLAEDGVVTDLITLEFLRKISEINNKKFMLLCDLAREGEGISRKRVEQEYKQCKNVSETGNAEITVSTQVEKSEVNQPTETFGTQRKSVEVTNQQSATATDRQSSLSHEGSIDTSSKRQPSKIQARDHATQAATKIIPELPLLEVEWREMQRAQLLLDRQPEASGMVWIKLLKSGDIISAELDDIKIKSVKIAGK